MPDARKPLLAAGAVVGLALAAAAALHAWSPGAWSLPPGSLDSVDIDRAGIRVTIRRAGSGFEVSAPVADAADARAAAAAFSAVEGLRLSDAPPRLPDSTRVRVTARRGGRVVLELLIGDNEQLVRIGGRDHATTGVRAALFDRAPNDWRRHDLGGFSTAEVVHVEIDTRDGQHLRLDRVGTDEHHWRVERSTIAIGRLDEMVVREIVTTFASLRATGFADAITLAAAGLDPPALTVRAYLADGHTAILSVGAAANDDEVYVGAPGRATIARARRLDVDRINRRPLQFRDKTLCDIPDADVVSFGVSNGAWSYAVVREGDGWHAVRPVGLRLDPMKVAPLAGAFRHWNAPRIAEDPPPGAFRVPRAVILAESRDARCTIHVGDESTEGPGYFVRTQSSPDVYVVPKWMIDRIVVRPDELRKA